MADETIYGMRLLIGQLKIANCTYIGSQVSGVAEKNPGSLADGISNDSVCRYANGKPADD